MKISCQNNPPSPPCEKLTADLIGSCKQIRQGGRGRRLLCLVESKATASTVVRRSRASVSQESGCERRDQPLHHRDRALPGLMVDSISSGSPASLPHRVVGRYRGSSSRDDIHAYRKADVNDRLIQFHPRIEVASCFATVTTIGTRGVAMRRSRSHSSRIEGAQKLLFTTQLSPTTLLRRCATADPTLPHTWVSLALLPDGSTVPNTPLEGRFDRVQLLLHATGGVCERGI